jgi:hypothetical protein
MIDDVDENNGTRLACDDSDNYLSSGKKSRTSTTSPSMAWLGHSLCLPVHHRDDYEYSLILRDGKNFRGCFPYFWLDPSSGPYTGLSVNSEMCSRMIDTSECTADDVSLRANTTHTHANKHTSFVFNATHDNNIQATYRTFC